MRQNRLYIIKHPAGPVKIGLSEQPRRRLQTIQQYSPFQLELVATFDVPQGMKGHRREAEIHEELSVFNIRGEWFDLPERKEQELIERADDEWNFRIMPADRRSPEERKEATLNLSSMV